MLTLAKAKTAHIHEPNRATWLAQTKGQLNKVGFTTSGHEAFDKELKLANAPLKAKAMPTICLDVPETCTCCDKPIIDEVVDGVLRGCRMWTMMCPQCHKEDGIGLGIGRGSQYKLVSLIEGRVEVFIKVEQ